MGLFLDMHIDCAALKIHFKKWDLCSLAIKAKHIHKTNGYGDANT